MQDLLSSTNQTDNGDEDNVSVTTTSQSNQSQYRNQVNSAWPKILTSAFETGEFSDFCFLVGRKEKKIRVHKLLLSLRSQIFRNFFQKHPDQTEYSLPEIPSRVFNYFIRYVYLYDLRRAVAVVDLLKLLDLSEEYQLPCLLESCINRLKTKLSFYNCLEVFSKASQLSLIELKEFAFKIITIHVRALLISERLLSFSNVDLIDLFKRDELPCSESQVFNAALRWVTSQCQKESGQVHSLSIIRENFTSFIPFIRFTLMSPQEIAELVVPTKVVSSELLASLFTYLYASDDQKPFIPFNTKPRATPGPLLIKSEPEENSNNNDWTTPVIENVYAFAPSINIPNSETNTQASNNDMETESISINAVVQNSPAVPAESHNNTSPELPSGASISMENTHTTENAAENSLMDISEPFEMTSGCTIVTPPASDTSLTSLSSTFNDTNNSTRRPGRPRRKYPKPNSIVHMVKNSTEKSLETYIDQLATNPDSLKTTKAVWLENCTITNHYPNNIRQEIDGDFCYMDLKIEMEDHFMRFVNCFDIRQFVFFRRHSAPWKLEELWSLKIPITIIVNGVTMFKMNGTEKELTISFSNGAREIMSGLSETDEICKLNLLNTYFPNMEGFPTKNLQQVLFYHLLTEDDFSLGNFIRQCPNLVSLTTWIVLNKLGDERFVDKLDFSCDLTSGPKLKHISLFRTKISFELGTVKLGVTKLVLDNCFWKPSFADNVHLIFPNLKKIVMRKMEESKDIVKESNGQTFSSAISLRMLINLLRIPRINYIRIWGMDWQIFPTITKEDESNWKKMNINVPIVTTATEVMVANTFLRKCGVSNQATNFVIRRESTKSSNWIGEEFVNVGSDNDVYWDMVDQLEFTTFKLGNVYDNWETVRKCFDSAILGEI